MGFWVIVNFSFLVVGLVMYLFRGTTRMILKKNEGLPYTSIDISAIGFWIAHILIIAHALDPFNITFIVSVLLLLQSYFLLRAQGTLFLIHRRVVILDILWFVYIWTVTLIFGGLPMKHYMHFAIVASLISALGFHVLFRSLTGLSKIYIWNHISIVWPATLYNIYLIWNRYAVDEPFLWLPSVFSADPYYILPLIIVISIAILNRILLVASGEPISGFHRITLRILLPFLVLFFTINLPALSQASFIMANLTGILFSLYHKRFGSKVEIVEGRIS